MPSTSHDAMPDGALLAFLGDDFTGSTDVMEAFSSAGVATVLFLSPPGAHWRKRFSAFRCIGLATTARSQSPEWMDRHLPEYFASLKAFGAPILQYKVCSTFDSSPHIGSIGRAIDLGLEVMGGHWSPMVVGVPRLKRYQAFGHLFAQTGAQVYRLDRSPTMSRHPVTPMQEADLRLHLARQTSRRIELVDYVQIRQATSQGSLDALLQDERIADDQPVVLFDVLDEQELAPVGGVIWRSIASGIKEVQEGSMIGGQDAGHVASRPTLFSASSSGLQYALVAYWRSIGWLPPEAALPKASPVKQIAAVCGSCSPLTAQQITWAQNHSFEIRRMDVERVLDPMTCEREIEALVAHALTVLEAQQSPLIFSALGPDDPSVLNIELLAARFGKDRRQAGEEIGLALAQVTRRLLERAPSLKRLAIAGGDSSGAIMSALNVAALSVEAAMVPGAPLCRAWSDTDGIDGLQVVLKGGQMGAADFFGRVLAGS